MPLREHLQNYLDTEQPENILLFRVSMALSLAACMFMALLSVLLRMERIVPVMLGGGVLITLAAMEGQRHVRRLEWVSGGYLFMMFFLLLPALSFRVAYAIYDFPVYFLTGIVFITVLFQKRWAAAIVAAVSDPRRRRPRPSSPPSPAWICSVSTGCWRRSDRRRIR